MTDDPTGLALRDHLDEVLAGLAPDPSLLHSIRAERQRRLRRRTAVLGCASVLTAVTATGAVLWGSLVAGERDGGRPTPLASAPGPSPSESPSSAPSASYPPAQPNEQWFTGPYAFPRPTGEIVRFPMQLEERDPSDSRRTLLVWYSAPKDTFCAMDLLQTRDHPDGEPSSGVGGCSAAPSVQPRHTNIVNASESCGRIAFPFVFGVLGDDATTVKAYGVGGPDPDVTLRPLDGAPTSLFVVVDATAPALIFRYLDADGHVVREQNLRNHHNLPGEPVNCARVQAPR
jgi:hypothetical protein